MSAAERQAHILQCVPFLLQYFNSRTCQLVLGAGAVEAVGLKTITARHLGMIIISIAYHCLLHGLIITFVCIASSHVAMVSRCLQAIMLLIPNLKRHFQQRLASKQHILLTQFDKVTGVRESYSDQYQK